MDKKEKVEMLKTWCGHQLCSSAARGCRLYGNCIGIAFEDLPEKNFNKMFSQVFGMSNDIKRTDIEIPRQGEIYRHFKGDFYVIVDVATHTETGEKLVIYAREYKTWARPLDMFLEEVDHEKYKNVKQKYRFERYELK